MEIPKRGKFYQGPGLRHTSDIFHVLTTQRFIIRSSPHMGVRLAHTKTNKQTNKRTIACPARLVTHFLEVFSFFAGLLSIFWEFMLVFTTIYFHTVHQKVLGALIAIFTRYITYRVWYHDALSPGLPWVPNAKVTGLSCFHLTVKFYHKNYI